MTTYSLVERDPKIAATWLPFRPWRDIRSLSHDVSKEVIWRCFA
jgi:hypothetical protein